MDNGRLFNTFGLLYPIRPNQTMELTALHSTHVYEVRPRKDKRGVDLISDGLSFGRLWYEQVTDATPPFL
jgi:hypothetical protein